MPPKIDSYTFGNMTIDGTTYASDLIIYPNGTVRDGWWRQEGHDLVPDDITALVQAAPAKLIVGTGASGIMRVSDAVLQLCEHSKIELVALRTAEAVTLYNKEIESGAEVGACFHLTC